MRYAQINEDGICIGVSDLSGEVDAPHMIALGPDENPLGHTWTGSAWLEPEPPPPSYQPLSRAAFTALVATGLSSPQKLAIRKDEAMELPWLEIGDLGDAVPRDHEFTVGFLVAAVSAGHLTEAQRQAVLDNWPTL